MPLRSQSEKAATEAIRKRTADFITRFIEENPKKAINQLEFAELSGIHMNRISKIINGKVIPHTGEIYLLWSNCGADPTYLFTGKTGGDKTLLKEMKSLKGKSESLVKEIERIESLIR